jgi:integrase
MPRPRNVQPAYLHHTPTNQAYIRIPTGSGGRRTVYLGEYGSAESKTAYRRLLTELDTAPAPAAVIRANDGGLKAPHDVLVSELYNAFWKYATQHYQRPDGTPTNELPQYKQTFGLVLALYGSMPAGEFGPLSLKAVRAKMIEANWSRKLINQRVGRIKRVFRWAAENELVPVAVYQALATVAGLQAGRTSALETEPIQPVSDAVVDATLPYLNRHVRGLIEFQRYTGCRPGEACAVRWSDIDVTGPVWLFRPAHHKTAWRGKTRVIAVGPRAQEVLKQFAGVDPNEYVFSPRRAVEEYHATRTTNRKTPRYASHLKRNAAVRKANPKRTPSGKYTVTAYEHAIARACEKAFPLPQALAPEHKESGKTESRREWRKRLTEKEWQEVREWHAAHCWAPNRLRHAHASRVRKEFSLEHAQVVLGHQHAAITEVYAEKNTALAVQVAAAIG